MRRRFACVVVIASLAAFGCLASERDDAATIVVFLFKTTPETTVVDGETYEVGLRKPGAQKFEPRTRIDYGTGFLVATDHDFYLVTAKHVASMLTPDSFLRIGSSGGPKDLSLSDVSGWQAELHWLADTDSDVAALRLKPRPNAVAVLQGHFMPASALSLQIPDRERTLTVVGFPLMFGAADNFSPISRETRVAGGPVKEKNGLAILLQDPSVGGYSGAPVFDLPGPIPMSQGIGFRPPVIICVGVMSGTFSDDTGGKMAAVVPASRVLSLLK